MLPYFQFTTLSLGPIPIQVWGLCVAVAILVALWLATAIVQRRGGEPAVMIDLGFWIVLSAFVGARVVYIIGEWQFYWQHPVESIALWHGGMSVIGGFLGAIAAATVVIRRRQLPVWEYVGAAVFALPLGLGIGRIGCFLIHDHPGTPTHFFLGQEYSDGIVRHNNGLYLSLNGFLMMGLFAYLWHRNPERSLRLYPTIFLLWYGTVRFFLDFLRATDLVTSDPRFFGLTIAQYASVLMVVGGLVLWYTQRKQHPS